MSKLRVLLVSSIIMAYYIEKLSAAPKQENWIPAKEKFFELITKLDEFYEVGFIRIYNQNLNINPKRLDDEAQFVRVASNLFKDKNGWVEQLTPAANWGEARSIFRALLELWDELYEIELIKDLDERNPRGFTDEVEFLNYVSTTIVGVCGSVASKYSKFKCSH